MKDNEKQRLLEQENNLITIEDYVWETSPQQLIELKNMFSDSKIKIAKIGGLI